MLEYDYFICTGNKQRVKINGSRYQRNAQNFFVLTTAVKSFSKSAHILRSFTNIANIGSNYLITFTKQRVMQKY